MTPEEIKKQNEETAAKLAEQGKDLTKPPTEQELFDSGSALDKLVEQKGKEKEAEVPETPPVTEEDAKKVAEAAAEAEKAKAEQEKQLQDSEKYFKDSPGLPPNASPKSSESFSAIKIKATQEISAREAKIEELNKKLAEYEEKLKNPVPAETEKELSELRQWRAKLDVDADPKFKEFDKQISQSQEFIYAQLLKSPVITDAIIAEIKKHGGPENVKMEKIFEAIKDPTLQRLVESKIADVEMAKFNKEQAIKDAKEHIGRYMEDRSKAYQEAVSSHTTATKTHLDSLTAKLPWYAMKQAPANADAAGKEAVEKHNAFVAGLQKNVELALGDDTPEMRAIMIAGMANLLYLQPQHEAALAKIGSLEKALKEANDSVARFKNASVNRLRESNAPVGGIPAAKKDESKLFTTPTTVALDDLAKAMFEQRQAAGK